MKSVCFVLSLLVIVAGCDKPAKQAEVSNLDPAFKAYLEFKRIPQDDKKQVEAAKASYDERVALVAAIQKTDTANDSLIKAEIADYERQITVSRYFEKFLNKTVNEQAVKSYYDMHPERYEQKRAHVAHIFFRTSPQMSDAEREAKMIKARDAYSKLSSGESFESVAAAFSEDAMTSGKGGDLGWMTEGAVDAAFSQQIFNAKKQSDESAKVFSEPFTSGLGIHIARVIEEPKQVKEPFDNVKGDILYQLRQEAKQAEMQRLLGKQPPK